MIQSVNGFSNTSAYEQLQETNKKKTSESNELAGALTGVAETGDVTNSTTASTVKAPVTDVMEISTEGRAAVAAQSAQEAENQTLSQAQPDQTLSKMTSATASQESTSVTSETSETVNLSGKTEDEINDLVDEGTITQSDANIELAKRAAQEAEKEAAEVAVPQSESSTKNSADEISKNGLAAVAVQE